MKRWDEMSFEEKIKYLAGGRVTACLVTTRLITSTGGNVFCERYMAKIRGKRFVTGPCETWHTEGRALRAGKKLLEQIRKMARELNQ